MGTGATCQGQKLDWWSASRIKCIGDISDAAAKPKLRVSRLECVCDHSLKYVAKRMPAGVLLATSPQTSWRELCSDNTTAMAYLQPPYVTRCINYSSYVLPAPHFIHPQHMRISQGAIFLCWMTCSITQPHLQPQFRRKPAPLSDCSIVLRRSNGPVCG